MIRHQDVRQRNDGMFEVIHGATIAGPFPMPGEPPNLFLICRKIILGS
ncbi:hypothetical protein P0R31_38775 [Bradyrhizobium yuanmingense]|nr:hypothetical protein [Bradyrhizobium yuanmingense]MDF0523164.1 hypothetical protein [Bradyrhizobium yuanmingense]